MSDFRIDWAAFQNVYPRHISRIFSRVRRLERAYDKLSEELERAVYELERLGFDDITGKAVLGTTPHFARNLS